MEFELLLVSLQADRAETKALKQSNVRREVPHLLHVGHQSLSVGQPLTGESRRWRKLITAEFQSNLKAVCVEVVEVLHPFRDIER